MVMGNIQKRTKEPEGRTEGPSRQTVSCYIAFSWGSLRRCHLILTRTLARHPELGMVRIILTVVEVKTHEQYAQRNTCSV